MDPKTPPTPTQVLQEARRLLSEGRWIRFRSAADLIGHTTSEFSEDAASFCLVGALRRAAYGTTPFFTSQDHAVRDALTDAVSVLLPLANCPTLTHYNDIRAAGPRDVLDLLDRGIQRLSGT